jgi:phosphoglycerate dehydrogenase-like enzyme
VLSAGVDRLYSSPIWNETEIAITNSSGVHGPQIPEWIILQTLSHFHRQKLLLELQSQHVWGSDKVPREQQDGVGQTFGVLATGLLADRQLELLMPSVLKLLLLQQYQGRHLKASRIVGILYLELATQTALFPPLGIAA